MIITCKKKIPLRWILFAVLPWASFSFNTTVITAAFVFSLKKFIDNPAGVSFVLSLPAVFAIVVAPLSGFLSDRIWTRFGRRKPFVIVASTMMVVALALMPVMPNVWALIGAYILFYLGDALASPRDPLKQEIVPPSERGRATGVMSWYQNFATVMFYLVILGRFDDVAYFAGIPINGEEMIYWSAALLLATMILLLMLGIKEVDQKSPLRGQRLSVRNFVGGLFDRELWPVYLLVVSFGLINFYGGFGPFLSILLYTEQWGYTKQEMGLNIALGGIVNIILLGLLTLFADRLPRMRAFRMFMYLSLAWNAFYFCYVNLVLPDRRPTLLEIILFGEVLSIISVLLTLLYYPLIYDYVRRNKMGTFSAGMQIATRGTHLFTLNGVGLFVWVWAVLFQPPPSEMTRITLRQPVAAAEMKSDVQALPWHNPADGRAVSPGEVSVYPWQADGTANNGGLAWELRLRDKSSEQLAAEKKKLESERAPVLVREKMARDDAIVARSQGDVSKAAAAEARAAERRARVDALTQQIQKIESELKTRAEVFRGEVTQRLAANLIAEGEQIRSAQRVPALVLASETRIRCGRELLERLAEVTRREVPTLIDLRPLQRESGYGVAASAVLHGESLDALASRLQAALIRAAALVAPNVFVQRSPLSVSETSALQIELQVLEKPVTTYVSPVTRAVNAITGWFGRRDEPTRRLDAVARGLREYEETNHVRVTLGSDERSLAVTALFQQTATQAASLEDPAALRLGVFLAGAPEKFVGQTRAFIDRVEKVAATQRITVAHPIVTSGYAAMRYDYMSGYVWVFFVGLVGVGLTYVFRRLEVRGTISKRGVEEAAVS